MARFRILSIDGGGIKGVFPASFLASLQETLDQPLAQYFDLIAGTSTGGIIALGLGLGFSPTELVDFYVTDGPKIFRGAGSWLRAAAKLFRPKFDSAPLRDALSSRFGNKKLGDATVRLLIPSFNASAGEIHVYKTRHHPKLETDYLVTAVEVALATTAAPTYFPAHFSASGIPFVDGGIWANNPTGMAVVEAITMIGQGPANLEVLSIGCTTEPRNFSRRRSGVIYWASKQRIIEAAFAGQAFGSMGTAYLIAGHDHVHRFDPQVEAGRFKLDDATGLDDLRGFGYFEARKALPTIRERFFCEPAETFKPCDPSHYPSLRN